MPDGISWALSSRWQALAAIPDADFEEHVAAVRESKDGELTLAKRYQTEYEVRNAVTHFGSWHGFCTKG